MKWPVWLLHLAPLHWQQSSPRHEARRLIVSLVMPFLKDSKVILLEAMQPPPWETEVCSAPHMKNEGTLFQFFSSSL